MTQNMKTTKNNEKEASKATKKYHIKKAYLKKNGFRVSTLCHIENVIFVFFKPTHPLKTSQWRFAWQHEYGRPLLSVLK